MREAAVGGDEQAGRYGVAIVEQDAHALFAVDGFLHFMAGEEMDVFMLAGGLVGSAADVVVGDEEAELAFAVGGRREVEGVGGAAVNHFGGFERVDAFGGDMLPQAEFFHDAARGVGEGDFAAVVGRVGQSFLAALFDEQDVQAAGCGCGGEAEAGRTGADNDDIASVLHGEAPLGVAGK